jgi:hypothetical protein
MAAPKLTLSQRRALLRLLDDAPFTVPSRFNALPYEHHVDVGYATKDDHGCFRLTPAGRERAEGINPGYRDWEPGGSVVPAPVGLALDIARLAG